MSADNVVKIAAISDKLALGESFIKAASKFKETGKPKTALVLGGTGEVGREVVKHLLASDAFDKVTVLTRRPIEYSGANADKLVQKPVDFEDNQKMEADFAGHTHAFSCLGTTRAKSGPDGFYKIDHDYVMNAAQACHKVGVEHYSICSAAGANKSSTLLYSRTKGEVDDEVQRLGFPRVSIYRPAMLECDRHESRPLERMGMLLLPVLKLVAPKSLAIPTSTVAWAMVSNTFTNADSTKPEIVSNAEMLDMFNKR